MLQSYREGNERGGKGRSQLAEILLKSERPRRNRTSKGVPGLVEVYGARRGPRIGPNTAQPRVGWDGRIAKINHRAGIAPGGIRIIDRGGEIVTLITTLQIRSDSAQIPPQESRRRRGIVRDANGPLCHAHKRS